MLAAIYDLEQWGITTGPPSRQVMLAVIDAVEAHGLTAYDAEYLVLAEIADADLMTGDASLAAAARDRTIRIGSQHRLGERAPGYRLETGSQATRSPDVDWPRWPGAVDYVAELRREAAADLAALRSRTSTA